MGLQLVQGLDDHFGPICVAAIIVIAVDTGPVDILKSLITKLLAGEFVIVPCVVVDEGALQALEGAIKEVSGQLTSFGTILDLKNKKKIRKKFKKVKKEKFFYLLDDHL